MSGFLTLGFVVLVDFFVEVEVAVIGVVVGDALDSCFCG